MSDILFGLDGQETLDSSTEEVLETAVDNHCENQGESFEVIVERVPWPVRVYEFRRMDVKKYTSRLAGVALDAVLEWLDEEHSDPDGSPADPTPEMRAAAEAFATVVTDRYVCWACEKTGEFRDYTREETRQMLSIAEKEATHE